ncbi:MAG: 50S ribosomal protein L11 methyltransferase [Rhizobium sp.]
MHESRRTQAARTDEPVSAAEFIVENLALAPAAALPEISLYTAHPGSGLWRLLEAGEDDDGADPATPYWAYRWAGGTVLARHILDRPETVGGLRVLDLGAGSGVVGIAAAKAGAATVIAADVDRNAIVATGLNARANGVEIEAVCGDLTGGPAPDVDLVAVGDLFYDRDIAVRVTGFLDRCLAAGITVLVGDPGRAYLPHGRLRLLAEYPVPDFADPGNATRKPGLVYSFEGQAGENRTDRPCGHDTD